MKNGMWRRLGAPVVLSVLMAGTLAGMVAAFVADARPASAAPSAPAAPTPSGASRTPYGEMTLAWTEPGMIGIVGWAKDPDVDAPIDVVVGVTQPGGLYVRKAGVFNPYLPGSYSQKFRAFLVAVPVDPGPRTMCIAALNVGRGEKYRLLGCKEFVVEPANPVGNLEHVAPSPIGEAVDVRGWSLDLETKNAIGVDITVDGKVAGNVAANGDRPDIGSAFPTMGSGRGFTGTVPAAPGRREVCAVGVNVGRGTNASLGCRTVDVPRVHPFGNLEGVSVGSDSITVGGWAGDPSNLGPIDVRITDELLGGIDDSVTTVVGATARRDDVAGSTGLDARAGFSATLSTRVPGDHQICVVAVNRGPGSDQLLGCRRVAVADRRPEGNVDSVVPLASGVRVTGWALRGVSPADPAQVRVTVDGAVTQVTSSIARPDVWGSRSGVNFNSGFQATINGLSAGRHSVCVTIVGASVASGVGGDRVFPCGSVVVGGTAVGTSGIAGAPIPVGPGGPLANVDRDAGVTVELRDGSVLWLFGDSVGYHPDGSMKYFVGGTGAWASADMPTVTRDAVDPSGAPYVLASPTASFPACSASRPSRVMWPLSAVRVPVGGLDRIVVVLANMCLRNGNDFESRGLSVAEWYYNPLDPPVARPVQLSLLNANVGLSRAYGTAAVVDAGGLLNLYQCDRPENLLDVGAFGPCRVARVDPAAAADPSQYRYWRNTGGAGTWVIDPLQASPMTMPAGALAGYNYPASSFTVSWDAAHGVYVMVYSPWPGFVDRAVVRVARSPQGPWTEPVEVTFPGCDNTVAGQAKVCYAGTAQPAFSTTTELGLGYYDQAIPSDRRRGQYMVVRVPFVVELA